MDTKEKTSKYLFQNYARNSLCFTHGSGPYLYDADGRKYLDLVAGIAVNSIGYSHPKWVKAVSEQAARMAHVSNLYHVKEQADLAERLASVTPKGMCRSLFVNSGAEANEGALKLAVRYTKRKRILSSLNSFHGRIASSLGATGQVKYRESFEPLISDSFDYFGFGDIEDFKSKITKDTAAVILEPIQGEGGVRLASREFFRTVRDICTDNGTLMIIDEVQTGMGRTGEWFGIQNYDVMPDVMTLAKALAGGAPIGAIVSTPEISSVLVPGTHGTTFGGNPLACAAGCATFDIIKEEKLVPRARSLGKKWMSDLRKVTGTDITEVRGMGMIIGIEMKEHAKDFQNFALSENVLVNVCNMNTVRLIPPLILSDEEADRFTELFRTFISKYN
ncbi:MAG: aspartate aminotransferase family protein [Methanomassiliicoccaceae archaeon]|jgi:acetylornithine aminotransferase/acetylornithine/N-succinyldiaminopimelate aminotransferase|nr:aspartate aminotransferase family protein [Methanomassiliicoccaceae archaeon]